eukprot:TRINITY_DN21148_c0_g1_i1.p1 TRINITY_DN21148_c0_g1~~TRINITY_DN21148_c0_g1_i1.p1  ORF type:complete len:293 (-),score=21.05 TRINITY_DN21148_c0_g1_i1:62-940(-)
MSSTAPMAPSLEALASELRGFLARKRERLAANEPLEATPSATEPSAPLAARASTLFLLSDLVTERFRQWQLDHSVRRARNAFLQDLGDDDPLFAARVRGLDGESVSLSPVTAHPWPALPRESVNEMTVHAGHPATPRGLALTWATLLGPLPNSDERKLSVLAAACARHPHRLTSPLPPLPSPAAPQPPVDSRHSGSTADDCRTPPTAPAAGPAAGCGGCGAGMKADEVACVKEMLGVSALRYRQAFEECTDVIATYHDCINTPSKRAAGCVADEKALGLCLRRRLGVSALVV